MLGSVTDKRTENYRGQDCWQTKPHTDRECKYNTGWCIMIHILNLGAHYSLKLINCPWILLYLSLILCGLVKIKNSTKKWVLWLSKCLKCCEGEVYLSCAVPEFSCYSVSLCELDFCNNCLVISREYYCKICWYGETQDVDPSWLKLLLLSFLIFRIKWTKFEAKCQFVSLYYSLSLEMNFILQTILCKTN